jgi:pyrimidine-nucleoside phosphorylase/thymidine phosphorylase
VTAREIIEKKRNGEALSRHEIAFFIRGLIEGQFTDYQASALLMAIFIRGMSRDETVALTREMRDAGKVLDLSSIPGPKVDKHSTGGVGDKTSLLLAPIAAVCGVKVPMITGRALGHTGGTLDKLQSIPGFDFQPSLPQVLSLLRKHGAVLMGQTPELAPADARLYALRDATGTVESIPLITASILSKKLAEGIEGLVLDVKTGSGAFMPSSRLALKLAQSLVHTGKGLGIRTVAVVTGMDQPLGRAVGNALEVRECLEFLQGESPEDLQTVTFELAAQMLMLARLARTRRSAETMAREAVSSGAAWRRFLDMVAAQNGDIRVLENPELLPKAANVSRLEASRSGFVAQVDARMVGMASNQLGAGRTRMEDAIDTAVGIYLHKKIGDRVRRDEILCEVHWNDAACLHGTMALLGKAFQIRPGPVRPPRLIRSVMKG